MPKAYHVSRTAALGALVLAAIALCTIIALSVAYNNERAKKRGEPEGETSDTSTTSTPVTPFVPSGPWDHYRLPDTLLPIHYNVTLWPQLEPSADGIYTFTGNSSVVFKCAKATDLIIIHSRKLNLKSYSGHHARLSGLSEAAAVSDIQKTWLVERTEFLVVQLSRMLRAGESYILHTEFSGELADDLEGFYRSEYKENGVTKVVATTQMQPTHARKAFPCFDEPAMKATFDITLIHSKETVALSNGKEMETVDKSSVKVTKFERTKQMSTYLLAFLVTDFSFIQLNQENLLVRIWARKPAIDAGHGAYALNVTGPVLKFFENYYNTSYPLSKSDQVALPDFNAGAMENWGLVTYRETALLYDPNLSSIGNKERIATVISHELAHMWFGNLVTLRWWNDLWLNEGFASYVEYLGVDYAEATWNAKEHIVLYDIQKVFAMDALASSQPLSERVEEVNTPAEISQMFNSISYSKGAAVLRMLSMFLSEPVFVDGLRSYLKAFEFGNAVYTDLWDHLQMAVDKSRLDIPHSVKDIMNRWTLQMGFPVVTIDTQSGEVSQKHFLLDPEAVVERESEFNYIWYVPIKWNRNGEEQKQYWLLGKTENHPEMKVSGEEWVIANTNVSGYFRVNYDQDNWERILNQLGTDHQAISVLSRAQIIDDAFNLARAKIINTTLALRTTKYLSEETDFIPWESMRGNIYFYFLMFDRTEVYGALQAYLRKILTPLFEYYKRLTSDWTKVPERLRDQYNQVNAVSMGCTVGVEGCKELVKAWFSQWMANPEINPIHPNLKSTVYCHALAEGGVEEWDFAWRMLKNATLASEEARLRAALACTKVPWLLNRYLEYSLDPAKIRKQDATSTIYSISGNVVGVSLAWNFVRARWNYIFDQYGKGSFSFSNLISGVTRRFSTEIELQELLQFKKDHLNTGFGSATMTLEQAIEKTKANIKWLKENKAEVLQWFTKESA